MSGPSKLIMALDLSTKCGWSLGRDFDPPRYGVWMLPPMSSLGACLSALAGQLEDAFTVMNPDLVVMESPLPPQAQTAASTARLQFGLAAVTEMICFERGVPCEEASAQVVRKLVIGRARVEKADVMRWARAEGWSPPDDNAADALALLRYRHTIGRMRVTAGAGSAA